MKDIEQLATQFQKAVDAALEDGSLIMATFCGDKTLTPPDQDITFFFAGEMETFYAKRDTMFAENIICINTLFKNTLFPKFSCAIIV